MGSPDDTRSVEQLLSQALSRGDIDEVFQLLDNNDYIDVNVPDRSHELQTPLMSLCHIETNETDRMAVLQYMLEKGPDINMQDGCGRTLLCHACISQRNDFVHVISSVAGCDPSLTDSDGNTALLLAVRSHNVTLVQLMLECFDHECLGLDAQNHRGVRPLDEAQRGGRAELRVLLQRALQGLGSPQPTRRARPHHSPAKHTPFTMVNPHGHNTPRTDLALTPQSQPADAAETPQSSATSSNYRRRHRGRLYKAAQVFSPQVSLDTSHLDCGDPNRTPRGNAPPQHYASKSLDTTQTISLDYEGGISDQDYDASDEDDEEESGEEVDEGYEEKPVNKHRRKNSISLPDLRGSSNLISGPRPSSPNSYSTFISDDFTSSCQNTGSSFDKPSQRGFTSTYDELSIPQLSDQDGHDLDEFDSENMPTFQEIQEKKDSLSLPDLRGCGSLVSAARTEPPPRRGKDGRKRDKSLNRRASPHDVSNDDDDVYGSAGGRDRMSKSHGPSQLTLPSLDVTNKTTNGSLPNLKVKTKKTRYYAEDPNKVQLAQVGDYHEGGNVPVVRKGHRKFKVAQQS